MNFTDPIQFKCAEYSHDGFFLAISRSNELTIFDSEKNKNRIISISRVNILNIMVAR